MLMQVLYSNRSLLVMLSVQKGLEYIAIRASGELSREAPLNAVVGLTCLGGYSDRRLQA